MKHSKRNGLAGFAVSGLALALTVSAGHAKATPGGWGWVPRHGTRSPARRR